MRIGELSVAAGVPIQTLRFYEREKLLREPPRTSSGYRSYSASDVARVRFIRDAQELGFTLKEIHELLKIHQAGAQPSNRPTDAKGAWQEAFQIAHARLSLIDKKIRQLQAFRRRLAAGLDGASRKQYKVCPAAVPAAKPPGPRRAKPSPR